MTKVVTPAASAWADWAGFSLDVMTTGVTAPFAVVCLVFFVLSHLDFPFFLALGWRPISPASKPEGFNLPLLWFHPVPWRFCREDGD